MNERDSVEGDAMKVLVITGIFSPDIGGPAIYVPQVAKGPSEWGHEVTILTLSDRLSHALSCYLQKLKELATSGAGEKETKAVLREMIFGHSTS